MDKLINYKVKDFFKLEDEELVGDYLAILEVLNPLNEIPNTKYHFYNKEAKTVQIKGVNDLSYGEVTTIRELLNEGSIESIIEIVKMISGLTEKQILKFTIFQFWGIISFIRSEIERISIIEENELADESFDINVEAVNAKQRMAKFGILNIIDALANNDVLKWQEIQDLPYMTVLTKMIMDKEKNKIQSEIQELQRKKQK